MRNVSSAILAGVVAVAVASVSACRQGTAGSAAQPAAQPARTVTDMKGRQVTIPEKPSRVALFGGPSGQIAYILGVQNELCAVTNTLRMSGMIREFDPRMATVPAPRTTNGSVNIEELIGADPEFVIAGDIDGELVQRKTRFPVVMFADTMNEGYASTVREVRFYGNVFNASERAERYAAYAERVVARLKARTAGIPESERPLVFNGYEGAHLVTLGGDTFLDERIVLAGCRNASKELRSIGKREGLHSGLAEVSLEQVVSWNPDIVIINAGSAEEMATRPGWKAVKAVQKKQVYTQPAGIFIWHRPTAESAVLYPLWLATLAHPDRFRDIDMRDETRRFYKEIMGFDLNDEHVSRVLSGYYESQIMRGARR